MPIWTIKQNCVKLRYLEVTLLETAIWAFSFGAFLQILQLLMVLDSLDTLAPRSLLTIYIFAVRREEVIPAKYKIELWWQRAWELQQGTRDRCLTSGKYFMVIHPVFTYTVSLCQNIYL